jgi:hypothetical protein
MKFKFLFSILLTAVSTIVAAQSITPVGSLSAPTSGHTATLLLDGRVLVVAAGRAEIFDPISNTWSLTTAMTTTLVRNSTATRLNDGRVLVVGGFDPAGAASGNAEIYDPTAATWSTTGLLTTPRVFHTASLLNDGSVLVTGGAAGSSDTASRYGSVERYNPSTGIWSASTGLPAARSAHTATVVNDQVILLGGTNASNMPTTDCLRYVQSTGNWTACAAIPTTRSGHTATLLLDGRIFLAGGAASTTTFEPIYSVTQDSWTVTSIPSREWTNHATSGYNGNRVIVWGGGGGCYQPTSSLLSPEGTAATYYTALNNSVSGTTGVGLAGHTMTELLDGRILVAGGASEYQLNLLNFRCLSASNRAFVMGKNDPQLLGGFTYGREPYSPEVGQRMFVPFSIGASNSIIPVTGTVQVSDGSSNCSATLPASGCLLNTSVNGPKQFTVSYSGDGEYKPASVTFGRPTGDLTRVELVGSGTGQVNRVNTPPQGYSVMCPGVYFFIPLTVCDSPIAISSPVELLATADVENTFIGWQGDCAGSQLACNFTMPSNKSFVAKAIFAPTADLPLKLDIDNNGVASALTDGQLIRRFMARVHDNELVSAALGNAPLRTSPDAIEARLTNMLPLLDVDQNGRADSSTDGLVILRFLLGFRGDTLVIGAIGNGARRIDPVEIANHLQSLMP